jgi:hypothetical protein
LQSVFKAMAFCKYSFYFRFVMPSTLSKNRKTRNRQFWWGIVAKIKRAKLGGILTTSCCHWQGIQICEFRPDKKKCSYQNATNHQR